MTAIDDPNYLPRAADQVASDSMHGPVPVDPDVAEAMGAFEEGALSAEDALDSHFDGVNPTDTEAGHE